MAKKLKKGKKKDDEKHKLCACGLRTSHGGPCGDTEDKRNADSLPVWKDEEVKPEENK